MKKHIIFFLVSLMLFTQSIYCSVNTRLVYVSNTYDSPEAGKATLIVDVEAISDAGNVVVQTFNNAFAFDATFWSQNPTVSFSDQLFPPSEYTTTENTFPAKKSVRYLYNFSGSTYSTITTSWIKIVRVTIEYTMTGSDGSIEWSSSAPNYVVIDSSGASHTGTEEAIPSQLQTVTLPVELISFNATLINDNYVKLNWSTATETNNYGFEIIRTINNNKHPIEEKIGFVEGHGISNSPKHYEFVDNNILGGNEFNYKLKQVDFDGEFSFSNIKTVKLKDFGFELFQNYPNPFNPSTNIKFSLAEAGNVSIVVYDLIGKEVQKLTDGWFNTGVHKIDFDAKNLSAGIYFYRLKTANFVQNKKMILLK